MTITWTSRRMRTRRRPTIGKKGRRFSGHVEAPKKKKKGEEEEEEFKSPQQDRHGSLRNQHLRPAELAPVTASLGTTGHFVFDLENCHLAVLRERHQPAADSALETYFQDRERILRDTHADRTVAKQLFLRLLYGGSILAWKRTHRLGEFATEQFAERFAAEMTARTTPSYLPSCGNGRRAPWSICSTPSTLRERGS